MSEMQKKTKVLIAIGLFILIFPTFAISGYGMDLWHRKLMEKDTDPRTPQRLITLIRTYQITYRQEKAEELIKEWLDRYGGDELEKPPEDRWLTWEKPKWDEDHPRPAAWNKVPNKLTATVLCIYAEHMEGAHFYQFSKHLFEMVPKYFPTEAGALERANKGLFRDRTRSSF
jgi:hypothetical protein